MGDSTPAKPRNRGDVFHIYPGFWRRVELTASTRLTCERQEPLREEPASRRPQGLRGLGRSGRRLRLYGAAEGRSAVGSPADCEASWVWLSGDRPGREGQGEGAAFKGRPERDGAETVRGPGCGLGGRAPCLRRTPTSSSPFRPPDRLEVAFLGSALFPVRAGSPWAPWKKSPLPPFCRRALSALS